MASPLSLTSLKSSLVAVCRHLEEQAIPELYAKDNGKTVGTYVEHALRQHLKDHYAYEGGNSAEGIDFPEPSLNTDLKVTSLKQAQSSCPFRDAEQKIYGLGYHLLLVGYEKQDLEDIKAARLSFPQMVFIDQAHTADYQTTTSLAALLAKGANLDDLVAFLEDKNLPLDEVGRLQLAERILVTPPAIGYLTISNALQWRLQYNRAISLADQVPGLERLYGQ
jgi:restriction system protein